MFSSTLKMTEQERQRLDTFRFPSGFAGLLSQRLRDSVLLHPHPKVLLTVLEEAVQRGEALLAGHAVVQPVPLGARPLAGVHVVGAHAALTPPHGGLVQLHMLFQLPLQGEHLWTGGAGELPLLLLCRHPYLQFIREGHRGLLPGPSFPAPDCPMVHQTGFYCIWFVF